MPRRAPRRHRDRLRGRPAALAPATGHVGVRGGAHGRRRSAAARRATALPRFVPGARVDVLGLPDGRLPAHWDEVKQALEDVAPRGPADVVFAPRPDDAHQDHRLRRHAGHDRLARRPDPPLRDPQVGRRPRRSQPLRGPAPRSTPGARSPCSTECFPSQSGRDWWDDELFLGLMRMRGVESRAAVRGGVPHDQGPAGPDREAPRHDGPDARGPRAPRPGSRGRRGPGAPARAGSRRQPHLRPGLGPVPRGHGARPGARCGRPGRGPRRQRLRGVRHGAALGDPRARVRARGRGGLAGRSRRGRASAAPPRSSCGRRRPSCDRCPAPTW